MAKGREETKLNYRSEIENLRSVGPATLYLLWGKEDYLREQYLSQLKKTCLPDGEDSFNYKRFDGPELSAQAFREAIDALPFLADRCFVELRDVDINKLKEAQDIIPLIEDIPDYCTVCFVQNSEYEPDGRMKLVKSIRSAGRELVFSRQSQSALTEWIARRFASYGKGIEFEAAQRLIFISGDLMNRLIPEIDKIAAYAVGDKVTVSDVEKVAHHIPEARIFDLSDQLAGKQINSAMNTLTELLSDNEYEPVYLLASLGSQMRRLYCARLSIEYSLGSKYVSDCCEIKYDFIVSKLINSARGFSLQQLKEAVRICAETDYLMKSSGADARELLKNAVLSIAVTVNDV